MRRSRRARIPLALLGLTLAGCVTEPPGGSAVRPTAGVIAADARALRYGASAAEVFNHPLVRDKVLAMFGPDWNPGGRVPLGAASYFPPPSPLRSLRIGDQDYIAITGCVSTACASHRGLVLVRQDAQHLMARIDEGGFSHYYDFAPGASARLVPRSAIDSAWVALQAMERS